jgi:hypothetical protein
MVRNVFYGFGWYLNSSWIGATNSPMLSATRLPRCGMRQRYAIGSAPVVSTAQPVIGPGKAVTVSRFAITAS